MKKLYPLLALALIGCGAIATPTWTELNVQMVARAACKLTAFHLVGSEGAKRITCKVEGDEIVSYLVTDGQLTEMHRTHWAIPW